MKTVTELEALKVKLQGYSKINGAITIQTPEMMALLDQAIADRKIINRWYGFLKMMAQRSSWASQINSMLDDYMFGTEDEKVQQAAMEYLERVRLHNRSH